MGAQTGAQEHRHEDKHTGRGTWVQAHRQGHMGAGTPAGGTGRGHMGAGTQAGGTGRGTGRKKNERARRG